MMYRTQDSTGCFNDGACMCAKCQGLRGSSVPVVSSLQESKENLKTLALQQCVDIYKDYDESEVLKFAPPSVQKAWEIGRELFSLERKANAEKLKGFVL